MAILSNGFEVIFTQRFGEIEKQIKVEQFVTDEKDLYENKDELVSEIKENLGVTITFRSSEADAQFFMDGLETLPEPRLRVDPVKGDVYLTPAEEPITLFDHSQKYYPLIPDLYRIEVVINGLRYYSWIKVLPKQLEEAQWETMKQEVERELKGLAKDLLLKKTGLNTRMEGISQELLEQFYVINHHFSAVMAAISDLYRKANAQITKEYAFVSKEKSRMIDEKTIRHTAMHPENNHTFKVPIRAVTYDLPENRLAKKIIESVSKKLTCFINRVEDLERNWQPLSGMEKEKTLKELEKLSGVAEKMRGAIHWLKTASWYEHVGFYQTSSIPHVMNSDPRYRVLYQLYRELNKEQSSLQKYQSYTNQWKRSDKLYEIWGYIQFIKCLIGEELAFVPESGWIYSQDDTNIRPDLPPNTEIVFKKNNLTVHLVYEAKLPTESGLTTAKKPLYTRGTHTCPDGRLEVYKDEIFVGTIIFDFKYRPRSAIWDESLSQAKKQNEVMRQLVSYSDNIHSPYLFGGNDNPFISRISPVQEVWAIYPNRSGQSRSYHYPDHKVGLIEVTPGQEQGHLVERIKESIDRLISTSEHMMFLMGKCNRNFIYKNALSKT
ncbi:DUF2357 domain-containing protein [Neobacillus niacini]|uniref:DUF2357 domain-containing protein n=1 Tax=Neobacillus niacini TaxID=86668 RepID=UPI00300128AF